MMKIYNCILGFLTIASSVFLSSCEDIDYSSQIIGDGEAVVNATIEFNSDVTDLGRSRSSGTAIRNIDDLNVVVYNNAGELTKILYLPNLTDSNTDGSDTPSDYPKGKDVKSEPSTRRVSFDMTLPYGRYRMYAVVNLGRNLGAEDASDEDKNAVKTIEGLKGIRCTWDFNEVGNNAQMFGYFTNGADGSKITASEEPDPSIVVNASQVTLHSWVKRLASKVTVAYDGSGLRNGVFVYIHNVSIRQIPLSCALGESNKPADKDEITGAYLGESLPASERNQVIYYDSKGVTDNVTEYDSEKYKQWLVVAKGTDTDTLGCNHDYNAQALYFYENMQGDFSDDQDRLYHLKHQNPDSVGTGIGTGYDDMGKLDYQDNVPYGTFIEVEAYYKCDIVPVSFGKIRYRFMLGQDKDYNYDATRNHHYKVTLGFNGYANQPDWHIEYKEEPPELFAIDVYVPYSYNTSFTYPLTIKGSVTELTAEIIENNWAPYDEKGTYNVPAATNGSTSFADRTLQFEWWRDVYVNGTNSAYKKEVNMRTGAFSGSNPVLTNSSSNYFYGRHPVDFWELDENGEEIRDEAHRYYVTPIWAGFLRLRVPEQFNDSTKPLPTAIIRNLGMSGAAQYGGNATGRPVLERFRNYYYGRNFTPMPGDDDVINSTDLHIREFKGDALSDGWHDGSATDRNSYKVVRTVDNDGVMSTSVIMKFWTQPKSMCAISGFSGNNPYEDYQRKAVVRFTAKFADGQTVTRDVTFLQSKRITNPKGVWRAHANPDASKTKPDPFRVYLRQRVTDSRNLFSKLTSQGEWKATIKTVSKGDDGFISLQSGPKSTGGGNEVIGYAGSEIDFTINFAKNIGADECKFAIVEVKYHNNTCTHNIFVRQGYNQPVKIMDNGPYWSSYNLYSSDGAYGTETAVNGVLAHNPLLFGAYFKRGNYRQAIAVSNISKDVAAFGPLAAPGNKEFALSGTTERAKWSDISGNTDPSWHWAKFNIGGKTYEVPTIADYQTLLADGADLGIGVMYGDGAKEPAGTTTQAFGFLDEDNTNDVLTSADGMRGFICYNAENAHQIFFPVGTSGMGRRTIQALYTIAESSRGTLRYGSVDQNLNTFSQTANSMRPIPMNMKNAPGAIYWAYTGVAASSGSYVGWDMNYFDVNFNGITNEVISISATNTGGGGDALPIRLVTRSL